ARLPHHLARGPSRLVEIELGEVHRADSNTISLRFTSGERNSPLVLCALEGSLMPKHESQCDRHCRTEHKGTNSVPQAPNQRQRIFGLRKQITSHRLVPFKARDGNPSVAARNGYGLITLPFPRDKILVRCLSPVRYR